MSDDNKDDAKPEGEGAKQFTIRVKDQVSFWWIMALLMFDVCGCLWHAVNLDSERGGISFITGQMSKANEGAVLVSKLINH
jgi:hypothetical protein